MSPYFGPNYKRWTYFGIY